MSINSKSFRSDAVVRSGIAARLDDITGRTFKATVLTFSEDNARDCYNLAEDEIPALVNAVESVMDYVDRCEESGITMQPGDVRRLVAAALGGAS